LRSNEPRLYEGIPVLLSKNKINYDILKTLVAKYGFWNEFGYFGEFTLRHFANKKIKGLVEYCRENLKPSTILYPYEVDFSRKYQTVEEKRWNLLGAPSYEELEHQFKVYSK
jgi:hypothetical protein